MKKITFWLEIVEKIQYQKVTVETIDGDRNVFIRYIDGGKEILLKDFKTYFAAKYIKVIGYQQIDGKNYQLKGYYLYTLKPRTN